MENLDAQLYSLAEQLDRIEEKIDGKHPVKFLDIKQVGQLTSVSISTIRMDAELNPVHRLSQP